MLLQKKQKSNCIRVYADEGQINNCIDQLNQRQALFQTIAKSLSLGGNEARLRILFLLKTQQKLCVCDLSDILQMTIPAVSQHLRKMKDGGILENQKVGKTIFYFLSAEGESFFGTIIEGIDNYSELEETLP